MAREQHCMPRKQRRSSRQKQALANARAVKHQNDLRRWRTRHNFTQYLVAMPQEILNEVLRYCDSRGLTSLQESCTRLREKTEWHSDRFAFRAFSLAAADQQEINNFLAGPIAQNAQVITFTNHLWKPTSNAALSRQTFAYATFLPATSHRYLQIFNGLPEVRTLRLQNYSAANPLVPHMAQNRVQWRTPLIDLVYILATIPAARPFLAQIESLEISSFYGHQAFHPTNPIGGPLFNDAAVLISLLRYCPNLQTFKLRTDPREPYNITLFHDLFKRSIRRQLIPHQVTGNPPLQTVVITREIATPADITLFIRDLIKIPTFRNLEYEVNHVDFWQPVATDWDLQLLSAANSTIVGTRITIRVSNMQATLGSMNPGDRHRAYAIAMSTRGARNVWFDFQR